MARVYIVNGTDHNYSSAKKFGELNIVTQGKLPIFKTDTMIALLKNGFKDFTADDYVLISGPTWLTVLTTVLLFTRLNEVKYLVFDAKEQTYVVRHLNTINFKQDNII